MNGKTQAVVAVVLGSAGALLYGAARHRRVGKLAGESLRRRHSPERTSRVSAGQQVQKPALTERVPDATAEPRKKRRGTLRFPPEDGFLEVAEPVLVDGRTLLGHDRLYILWQSVKNVHHLHLPAAEVGSFRGGSAYFLASSFLQLAGDEVEMHVFDTFEGHPEDKISDFDPFHKPGMFASTSYEEVKAYLARFARARVHKGEFSSSVRDLDDRTFSFAHIDTDLYQPTLESLQYFGNRLAAGGIIVVDDYASRKCPGVARAVAQYAPQSRGFQVWDVQTDQLVLVKR